MDLLDEEKEVQNCIDKIGQSTKKTKKKKETGHQMFLTFFRAVLSVVLTATSHRSCCSVYECNYHICCGHYPSSIPSEGVFLGSVQYSVGCVCSTKEDCIAAQ